MSMHCENQDHTTFPLLHTKLCQPTLTSHLVPRLRLLTRLTSGLQRRLTLISAAAGAGKTTLLCEWLNSLTTKRVAWLTLDEDDTDPICFWRHLLKSLALFSSGLDTQLLPLLSTTGPDRYFLTTLVNRLNSVLEQETSQIVLVLDDYHVITNPVVHRTLNFLIEHLGQIHFILVTRFDPPLRLARLRGRGQIFELRDADLRFNAEESAAFLRKHVHHPLTEEEHNLLFTQTEGWVTGLQLAALTLQNHVSPSDTWQTFKGNQHYILEYLTDEVIQQQPESIRIFLLHTCILERFSASLCDALCQQTRSQEILAHLEHNNLFLIPLDNERQWFRYHHLFADVLRIHLQRMPSEQRNALHIRASEWYEQHGYWHEAIHHALIAHHWPQVMRLIVPIARTLIWKYGEVIMVQRWLEQIPQEFALTHPRLCLAYAWLFLLQNSPGDIERWLEAADAVPDEAPPFIEIDPYQHNSYRTTVASQVYGLRVLLSSMRRDIKQTLALCQQASVLQPPDDPVYLALVQNAEGLALYEQGQAEAAYTRFLAASENYLARGIDASATIMLDLAAQAALLQGNLQEAWKLTRLSIHVGSVTDGSPLPNTCYAYATSASILAEWNDLDGALEAITQGIVQGKQTNNRDFLCDGYLTLASIYLARSLLQEAQMALVQADEIARKRDIQMKHLRIAAAQASLWLVEGKLDKVARWQQQRQQQKPPAELLAEMQALIDARYALLKQCPQEALAILNSLLPAAEAGKRGDRVLKILLLQVLAYQALEYKQAAGACLERLLPLAEQGGYLRLFLDTGIAPDRLFTYLPNHLKTSTTVRGVLRAWQQSSLTIAPPSQEDQSVHLLVTPLSPREREILDYIARGASNQEIAEALIIAPNTVKRHISHILSKLGVSTRTQALIQARKIGLLS